MIEVNPFAVVKNGDVVVLDCKASFDDNAFIVKERLQR